MYRNMLNRFALQSVIKAPNIPDFHLMVGSAEDLASLPLLIYDSSNVPSEIVQGMSKYNEMTSDDIQQAIADNVLEVNDINMNIATLGM